MWPSPRTLCTGCCQGAAHSVPHTSEATDATCACETEGHEAAMARARMGNKHPEACSAPWQQTTNRRSHCGAERKKTTCERAERYDSTRTVRGQRHRPHTPCPNSLQRSSNPKPSPHIRVWRCRSSTPWSRGGSLGTTCSTTVHAVCRHTRESMAQRWITQWHDQPLKSNGPIEKLQQNRPPSNARLPRHKSRGQCR